MSKQPDDDPFKDSVMTFGEHLNELRSCLWHAILGLGVGILLGFFLADDIVKFIQSPLEGALREYYRSAAKAELEKINPDHSEADLERVDKQGMVFERVYIDPQQLTDATAKTPSQTPPPADTNPNPQTAPSTELKEFLLWHKLNNDPRTHTKSLSGQEPFMIWLKAALIAGCILSSPWTFYQLWSFIAAGLYPKEKNLVHVYLPISLGLFFLGVFVSSFVFPPILKFFLSFNRSMGIEPEPRITEWLSFVLFLPLGFGLAFQLPLVMLFLERVGILTVASYLRYWRVSVLVIWVIAAVLTPGDPYSIFFLAVPLMLLFFAGVLLCKWWPHGGSAQLQ
ncbi:MAG TPA: twin-arginine translocase subunit TatC [Pirellulales bacterium]